MSEAKMKLKLFTMTIVFLITIVMPIKAQAYTWSGWATYTKAGITRRLDLQDGQVTATLGDSSPIEVVKPLVAKEVGFDKSGTGWILFKNGALYFWNPDLNSGIQKVTTIPKSEELIFSDDGKSVVAFKSGTSQIEVPSVEALKDSLGIKTSTDEQQATTTTTQINSCSSTKQGSIIFEPVTEATTATTTAATEATTTTTATTETSTVKSAWASYTRDGIITQVKYNDGILTAIIDDNTFVLSNSFILDELGFDTNGTAWIVSKSGEIFFWNKDVDAYIMHQYSISNGKLVFSENGKTVVALLTGTSITEVPSVEELLKFATSTEQLQPENTSEATTQVGTSEAITEATTRVETSEVTTEATSRMETSEASTEATTRMSTSEASTEATTQVSTSEATSEATTRVGTSEASTEATTRVGTSENTTEATTRVSTSEATSETTTQVSNSENTTGATTRVEESTIKIDSIAPTPATTTTTTATATTATAASTETTTATVTANAASGGSYSSRTTTYSSSTTTIIVVNSLKATQVVNSGIYHYLYSGQKCIASYTLQNNVLKYYGKTIKGVKYAGWNKNKKNLIFITKGGKVKKVDYKTGKIKTLVKKGGKKLIKSKKGFVTYVKKANGKKISAKAF